MGGGGGTLFQRLFNAKKVNNRKRSKSNMAKIGKQWGSIIACWAVALAFIITGICLGTIIPSKAADEDFLAVTFDVNGDGVISDDETTYYASFRAAGEYVNTLSTTAENRAVVKVTRDVLSLSGTEEDNCFVLYKEDGTSWCTFDLNGHVLKADAMGVTANYEGHLTIIDSQPTLVHYYQRTADGDYLFVNEPTADYTAVYGGVLCSRENSADDGVQIVVMAGGELVIDGGTYLGRGCFAIMYDAKMIFNKLTSQMVTDNPMGMSAAQSVVLGLATPQEGYEPSILEINGGMISGNISFCESDPDADSGYKTRIIDLANVPDDVPSIKVNVNLTKTLDTNGLPIYTSENYTPTINPDVPPADDQPTDNQENKNQSTPDVKTNLIGLIVLGVAAAVMVVGVTTIIIVNTKKRKKVA